LDLPGGDVPPPGADVVVDGKTVGGVTSAVAVPGEDRVIALAMVRREVEPPAAVTITVSGQPIPATVRA
jgi:glycine cleavage system aminomethyltransferase T